MTYAFPEFTITTWGRDDRGRDVWRVRSDERVTEFAAPRAAPLTDLYRLARAALRRCATGEPE